MQRYRHYGTTYSSSSAPVEEVHAEEEVSTEEEVFEEDTEPLVEEGVRPEVQQTGKSGVLTWLCSVRPWFLTVMFWLG